MAYATASHWVTTEWSDELEAIARNKFVPLIMGCGATGVQMIRTGEYDFTVITHYADEATATAKAGIQRTVGVQACDGKIIIGAIV